MTVSLEVDTQKPVLVTGATGYVAGRVIERLLEEGLTVRATVRDPSKKERLAYLVACAEKHPGTIEFFAADLTKEGSFAEAMAGCGIVFHIASPFALSVKDAQKELIDPALGGTRNVLEEVDRTDSVNRVVLTSSCAAIYGDNVDLQEVPGGVLTEDVWNTSSSLTRNPYSYSKTLAEKEAWKIHDAQSRWKLVAVNPCMVMGPGLEIHSGSESFSIIKRLGDGTMASGVPDLGMGVIDVRDLAEAHLRAAFVEGANGRNIIKGTDSSLPQMADALRDKYGQYPLPKRTAPKFLIWLVGPMIDRSLSREFVSRNVGLGWKADNGKSKRELGMQYRPLRETMQDFFQQLIDEGVLEAR